MRWAISGGAGFLGLHLARRLLADGYEVRTLDVAPLDDPGLEASVEEVRGDVRDPADARRLAEGTDVLVHAAAALPIQASRDGSGSASSRSSSTGSARAAGSRFWATDRTATSCWRLRTWSRRRSPPQRATSPGRPSTSAQPSSGPFARTSRR